MDTDPESDPDLKPDRHIKTESWSIRSQIGIKTLPLHDTAALHVHIVPLSQFKRRPVAARDGRIPRTDNPGGLHRLQSLDDLSERYDR
jgi:hypothetical protein